MWPKQTFTRGNIIVGSGSFTANDGSGAQPSSVVSTLSYTDMNGSPATTTVTFTSNGATPAVWSGSWNSSVCIGGNVDWKIQATGALVAAQEGSFTIEANSANQT